MPINFSFWAARYRYRFAITQAITLSGNSENWWKFLWKSDLPKSRESARCNISYWEEGRGRGNSHQRDTTFPFYFHFTRYLWKLTISWYLFNEKIKNKDIFISFKSLVLIFWDLMSLHSGSLSLLVELPTDLGGLKTYLKFRRRSTIRPNWPRIL